MFSFFPLRANACVVTMLELIWTAVKQGQDRGLHCRKGNIIKLLLGKVLWFLHRSLVPGSFRGPGLSNVTGMTRELESNNCCFDLSVQLHIQDLAAFSAQKKYVCSTSSSLKQTCYCYYQRTQACFPECRRNQTRDIVFALIFCLFVLPGLKMLSCGFFPLSPSFSQACITEM